MPCKPVVLFILGWCGGVFLLDARAAVVVFEDFENLPNGEINGYTGSQGVTQWVAQTTVTEVTNAPTGFDVTLPTGEVISGGSNGLLIDGNSNTVFEAFFDTPQTEDLYVGFLLHQESGNVTTNDFAALWLGQGSYIGAPSIGIKAQLGPNNTDFMGRITGTQEAYANDQLGVGNTYYLVAKISKAGGSTTYNQVDFWVNPGSDQEANPEATSTGNIAFEEFSSFGFRTVNLSQGERLFFDHYVIGTTWEDVVVPEPSSGFLCGLAVGAGLLRRRCE